MNMFRQPYLNAETDLNGGNDEYADFLREDEVVEEVVAEETTEKAEDTKPAEVESPKYKLKYNHEEKEVTLDELTTLGQKGMNYDKLQEKFNEIQSNPALSKYSRVTEVSELLGYQSDDELLEALYQTYYDRTAETQGLTPQQIKKDHELSQKEKAVKEKESTLTKKQNDNEMYSEFTTNYPNVKAEMIKPETWVKVNAGMDLTKAYTMQHNAELQEQLKILQQNEKNTQKAPIGGVGTHGSEATISQDPFEIGFDSIK